MPKLSALIAGSTGYIGIQLIKLLIKQATYYDVRCNVKGGGPTGQAGAMVHGISKALVMFDESLKSTLKTEKMTTRDSRAVERKKPGRKKARRSFQFSKR